MATKKQNSVNICFAKRAKLLEPSQVKRWACFQPPSRSPEQKSMLCGVKLLLGGAAILSLVPTWYLRLGDSRPGTRCEAERQIFQKVLSFISENPRPFLSPHRLVVRIHHTNWWAGCTTQTGWLHQLRPEPPHRLVRSESTTQPVMPDQPHQLMGQVCHKQKNNHMQRGGGTWHLNIWNLKIFNQVILEIYQMKWQCSVQLPLCLFEWHNITEEMLVTIKVFSAFLFDDCYRSDPANI